MDGLRVSAVTRTAARTEVRASLTAGVSQITGAAGTDGPRAMAGIRARETIEMTGARPTDGPSLRLSPPRLIAGEPGPADRASRIAGARTAVIRAREMTGTREIRTGIRMTEAAVQTAEECPAFRRLPRKPSPWRRKDA